MIRRLSTIENDLNTTLDKDRSSYKVYDLLWELSYAMMRRYKISDDWKEADDVACRTAADIYMRIQRQPNWRVTRWLSYLRLYLKGKIRGYRSEESSVIIDVSTNPELKDSLNEMNYSSAISYANDAEIKLQRLALKTIDKSIKDELRECCKYNEFSVEFTRLHTSVLLSLLNDGNPVNYKLNQELANYLPMLIKRVYYRISEMISQEKGMITGNYSSVIDMIDGTFKSDGLDSQYGEDDD